MRIFIRMGNRLAIGREQWRIELEVGPEWTISDVKSCIHAQNIRFDPERMVYFAGLFSLPSQGH